MKFHFIASENPEAKEALKVLIKRYNQTKLELSDVIIAIGGDGMLLKALRNSIEKNKPVFGLNKGNVGFLMNELSFDNLENRIQTARKVKMHPLFMSAHKINGNIFTELAVNEVSILRQTHQAAHLKITVDKKERLNELVCDGILVSTPIGSTAYNLSARGPIIPLNANILALTPISSFRPRRWRGALLPQRVKIRIEVLNFDTRPVSATADNVEARDIKYIEISTDKTKKLTILHDSDHSLDERIMKEQFLT
ncbi:MAG: NAD kinase [Alphaproteobacteria bacterium]|nr:MAG: NAD kinase [Alphaproteobacteria bacterium]|tara:strand:- start:223 stop:981 length:759 start_codon:yes stop_codon:yes gene_type:complete